MLFPVEKQRTKPTLYKIASPQPRSQLRDKGLSLFSAPLQGFWVLLDTHRVPQMAKKHGLYGSTTHILSTVKGKGQEAVSMKPEAKVLPSRPTRPHTGAGCTLWLVTQVLAEHRNTGYHRSLFTPQTKGLSSLSYVQDFRGSAPLPPCSASGDDDGLKLWGPSLPICAVNSATVLL